jgi:hypothetical protein
VGFSDDLRDFAKGLADLSQPISKTAMPILLRNVAGYNWGFFTREDQIMHLQTIRGDHKYKVILERDGHRVFEPVGNVPPKVVRELRQSVQRHEDLIEDEWAALMVASGWVDMLFSNPVVTLVAYPGHNQFVREVDLSAQFPGAGGRIQALSLDDLRLDPEMPSLSVQMTKGRAALDIRLPDVLWEGQR